MTDLDGMSLNTLVSGINTNDTMAAFGPRVEDQTGGSEPPHPEASTQKQPPSRRRRKESTKAIPEKFRASKRSQNLAKNRQAAHRYRLRQKESIKKLERKHLVELEKRRARRLLLRSLQMEMLHLRDELIQQSACNCLYFKGYRDFQTASLISHTALPLSPCASSDDDDEIKGWDDSLDMAGSNAATQCRRQNRYTCSSEDMD